MFDPKYSLEAANLQARIESAAWALRDAPYHNGCAHDEAEKRRIREQLRNAAIDRAEAKVRELRCQLPGICKPAP